MRTGEGEAATSDRWGDRWSASGFFLSSLTGGGVRAPNRGGSVSVGDGESLESDITLFQCKAASRVFIH